MPAPLRTLGTVAALSTALLLPAVAPAVAGGAHPAAHAAALRAARPPLMRVVVNNAAQRITVSRRHVRPGNTVFRIRHIGAGGSIELLRLHDGYSAHHLQRDFGKLFSGDVKTVRRIDRSVEFYGGTGVPNHTHNAIGVYLQRGTYFLMNLDKGTRVRLTVEGRRQDRRLPHASGTVDYAKGSTYDSDRRLPAHGWISQTNHTDEPHFTGFTQVKMRTTRAQVRRYFKDGAKGRPSWLVDFHRDALPLSPGRHMVWYSDARRGTFVEACFWPSDEDGMPHALMGMWDLTHLR